MKRRVPKPAEPAADDDLSGRRLNPELARVVKEVMELDEVKVRKFLINHMAYSDAHDAGMKAHVDGKPLKANPYAKAAVRVTEQMTKQLPQGHTYPVEALQDRGWRDGWELASKSRELRRLKKRRLMHYKKG